jgi:hypothetical protein
MKKTRTKDQRLLLRMERIRILAQTEFYVVDGGDGSDTSTTNSRVYKGEPSAVVVPPPTTCD